MDLTKQSFTGADNMPRITILGAKSAPLKLFKKSNGSAVEDGLPTEMTDTSFNPLSSRYLFIAPPGFGKTDFFMSIPGALLLACEEGHKGIKGHKIIIDAFDYKSSAPEPWKDSDGNMHMSFIQAIDRLEDSDRFPFVVVDTVDALVKLITDFAEIKGRVEHISELGDYGKGFDLGQNSPFRKAINQIIKTGRGIGFTTHQQVNQAQFKSGPRAKKETTLPAGIAKLLIPQVDVVMQGEFGGKRKPNRFKDRIIRTEGNEDFIAKNRGGILPCSWIVPLNWEERWKQFEGFFKDPKTIAKAEAEYTKLYES